AFNRLGVFRRSAEPSAPPMRLGVHLDFNTLLFPHHRPGPRRLIGINVNVSASDIEYCHHGLPKLAANCYVGTNYRMRKRQSRRARDSAFCETKTKFGNANLDSRFLRPT